MRSLLNLLFILFYSQLIFAQEGFQFETSKNKITIPFEVYNNLVVIPIEINGAKLKFLLDTGIKESILFSLDDSNEINFSQVEKIKIRGFGENEPFDGYKSINNTIKIKDYVDKNHILYLILNQEINISTQVGIPINGILGYYFFKNNLVKINYETKKIIIYKNKESKIKKITKRYSKTTLDFINSKPYFNAYIQISDASPIISSKLLLDTGNSDALWIFKDKIENFILPKITLNDFLGRGFSGDVFGDRARINNVTIGNYKFINPLVAFPNISNLSQLDINNERVGSIGSEILRRFTIYYDYQGKALFVKKNASFLDKFNYNMSGIEILHQGLRWIKQSYQEKVSPVFNIYNENGDKSFTNNLKFNFELKPLYIISNIRKNSPADLSGLKKDDIILKINSKNGYNLKLQEINDLLKSEEGKIIEIQVERNGKIIKYKFQLKSII